MLARLSRAFFYRHPTQVLLALVGIAAGVAVVTGVALLRGALVESLDAVSAELAGDRALVVRHASGRLDVDQYARLARKPGAPDFVPVLHQSVRAAGQRLEVVGVDPFSSIRALTGTDGTGLSAALFGETGGPPPALVSRSTLDLLEAQVGDVIEIDDGEARVRLSGVIEGRQGLDRRLLMDIALAQDMLSERGWVSELLAPPEAEQWLRANLGEALVLDSAAGQRTSARELTAGMRANLTAMSLLALATGLFVVYSVLSFLMVQRRRTFGLLRALGMTQGTLARMLVGEVLLIAAFGALAGLLSGTLLSDQLLGLIASPVAEVYGQLPPAATRPSLGLYALIWLAALAAAVAVTLPVLREALTIPPGRLVRAVTVHVLPARKLVPPAAGLVAGGALWIVLDDRLVAALGGLFLILAGVIVLIPMIGFGVLRSVARRTATTLPGRALRLLESARGRLSPALAALSLALALAIGMGMMILGFRGAVDDWVTRLLQADMYVSMQTGSLAADQVERIAGLSGVDALSSVRRTRLADGTSLTAYELPMRARDGFELLEVDGPGSFQEDYGGSGVWHAFDAGAAVLVSESLARRRGLAVGEPVELLSPDGPVRLPVAAVFRDYSSEQGFVAASGALYRSWFDDRAVDSVGLYLEAGVDPDTVGARIEAMEFDGTPQWITPGSIQRESLAVFDRTFRISWALALLVGLIALVALTSALLAQGLERSREHATLRALGLEPARLFRLVTVQSAGLTAIALVTALPLAVMIHYALSLLIQPRAFGWTLPLGLPPAEPVLWVVPTALVLGTVTGLYPAWRIGRRPVVEHLRAGEGITARFGRRGARPARREERAIAGPIGATSNAAGRDGSAPKTGNYSFASPKGRAMMRDAFIAGLLALVAIAWLVQRADPPEPAVSGVSGTALLNAAPESFERITGPEPLAFPADHAMHPGYRNEWWYFTGNLADDDGRRYGFQFTLFRFAVDPGTRTDSGPDSDFATEAVWMAHLAVSDIDNERFIASERFARDALGLAGATAEEWWLRDWTVSRSGNGWRLRAQTGQVSLDLTLAPEKPIVLQGDSGYSRKGPAPGNASRYYSITRMEADGRLEIDDRAVEVSGSAWLDREWGSSQLGEGIAGWDWFALQFDDGRDLMLYRLRTEGGEASRFSAGVLVEPDGTYRVLDRDDFAFDEIRRWRDPVGVEWPVAWRVRLPAEDLDFEVRPAFEAQRWRATVEYWEGAVDVIDPASNRRLGRGYLELSGYADAAAAGDPGRLP